jgi:hypothetical protein
MPCICIISGSPSALWDDTSPDWAPSQNLGYSSSNPANRCSSGRYSRLKERNEKRASTCSEPSALSQQPQANSEELPAQDPCVSNPEERASENIVCDEGDQIPPQCEPTSTPDCELSSEDGSSEIPEWKARFESLQKQYSDLSNDYNYVCKKSQSLRDQITNLEVDKLDMAASLEALKAAVESLKEKLHEKEEEFKKCLKNREKELVKEYEEKLTDCLQEMLELRKNVEDAEACTFMNYDKFGADEDKVRFYTGLPSFAVFECVLNGIVSFLNEKSVSQNRFSLQPWQSLLLTLMRLRLSLTLHDLAYRFGVSESTACRTFERWLDHMYTTLYPVTIKWPERETMRKTMPREFRESYGNSVAVIVDCFEIFTEKPSSLDTRSMIWSNYKHHHTAKVLIGISPTGAIIFVSTAWGARTSDKEICFESGLYEFLLPHDVVMADRGFNIAEHLALYNAKLLIPAFTRGQDQLSSHDVSLTRNIAHLRIHVERVIGLVRRKYRILKSILPVEHLTVREGQELAPIDKIVGVCCALTNLCPSVVVHPEQPD